MVGANLVLENKFLGDIEQSDTIKSRRPIFRNGRETSEAVISF